MSKRILEKFIEKANEKFGLSLSKKTYKRLYPGHWQRSSGCFSWIIYNNDEGRGVCYGSQTPMTELLKKWDVVDITNAFGSISYEFFINEQYG